MLTSSLRVALATLVLGLSPARVAMAESETLLSHAISLMKKSPLIDTHVDLPQILRSLGQ